MVEYEGFPSMVGFGQREGLQISPRFVLTQEQAPEYAEWAVADGWEPLPIPEAILSKILFQGIRVPLDLSTGRYVCRVAGDSVLISRETQPCAEVDILPDLILGVLDTTTSRLCTVIRAGY